MCSKDIHILRNNFPLVIKFESKRQGPRPLDSVLFQANQVLNLPTYSSEFHNDFLLVPQGLNMNHCKPQSK